MPSRSLARWNTTRKKSLDSALAGHGKKAEGVVLVRQQVTQGTAMLPSSQFQGFCRDLHSECVDAFVAGVTPAGAGNAEPRQRLQPIRLLAILGVAPW